MNYTGNPARVSAFDFMYRVYGWMSAALGVTAAVAYYVGNNVEIFKTVQSYFWPIVIVQFALVIGLSGWVTRMSYGAAIIAFMVYAMSVGLTTSVVFLVYTKASIYSTFAITALMFGVTALYGYTTRRDLTSMGNMLFMGLIGLIIAGLVNVFLKNPVFQLIISCFGVIIFTALTAYDVQKIKQLAAQMMGYEELQGQIAIIGALTLYLDVLNLFLYLLQFTGRRRD